MSPPAHQKEILDRIIQQGLIAIIRQNTDKNVLQIAEAIAAGGVRAIEITIGTPNALKLINTLADHPGIIPGVGSVLDAPTAIAAIESGAEYVVTPVSRQDVIEAVHQLKKARRHRGRTSIKEADILWCIHTWRSVPGFCLGSRCR
jgi:2-dehydro-3-deoxyphosphogluconate aldolase/(4S)-4-hydroxy-2-oxoglutarate aldolase